MAAAKISLNEMRDQVGRLIFGDDWIGGLTDEERKLLGDRQRAVVLDYNNKRQVEQIERALVREAHLQGQIVTVNKWLQDHKMLYWPDRNGNIDGDRKAFLALIQSERAKQPPAAVRPGPKGKIGPALIAALKTDLEEGRITREQLGGPFKALWCLYPKAKRESLREARNKVLAELAANNSGNRN